MESTTGHVRDLLKMNKTVHVDFITHHGSVAVDVVDQLVESDDCMDVLDDVRLNSVRGKNVLHPPSAPLHLMMMMTYTF